MRWNKLMRWKIELSLRAKRGNLVRIIVIAMSVAKKQSQENEFSITFL